MTELVIFKNCNKCQLKKTSEDFYKSKLGKYGLRSICKICSHIQNKKYAKVNRRNYYLRNIEKHKEKNKKYAQLNYLKEKNRKVIVDTNSVKNVNDRYVKRQLKIKGFISEAITPELIEVQRLIIKTKRLCKTLQNYEQV
jgi:hypothetical protein